MNDDTTKPDQRGPAHEDLIEIDLNFASMRRFQAEFSQNLAPDGLFIDTAEPLGPGSVVRFRVVLPEDFVFLEGTAVVEWAQRPDDGSSGPPGMALRFVTMSSQNQELVEQLVQDHVEAGGQPFDLDVRPMPTDFPTDALEGPPTPAAATGDEAFRLTIRDAGLEPAEQALQALAEAAPDAQDTTAELQPETVPASSGSDDSAEPEAVADPPELDLGDEDEDDRISFDEPADGGVEPPEDQAPGDEDEVSAGTQPAALEVGSVSRDVVLPEPEDFDDGPEVIDGIDDGLGGTAFDVSLPEDDDEPDSTPMLPDDGGADVTVPPDDEPGSPSPRRARWWVATAALVVIAAAAAAVAFWPRIGALLDGAGGEDGPAVEMVAGAGSHAPVEPAAAPEPRLPAAAQPSDGGSVIEGDPDESADPAAAAAESGDGGADTAGGEPDHPADGAPPDASAAATGEPSPEPATVEQAVEEPTPARVITELAVEPGDGNTVVRLRGDGSLEDGAISVETLRIPPRILIRVRGIESGYRPHTIDAVTPEVSRVRVGHHVDRTPPELWVVLDLTGNDVALDGIDLDRDTARIAVGRP